MTSADDGSFSYRKVGPRGELVGPEIGIDRTRPWVRIRCACGGEVTAGRDTQGHGTGLHTMPACAAFIAEPLDEFLHSVRIGALLAHGPNP